MAYDLDQLRSYVRFYQSVVAQLEAAWSTLQQTNTAVLHAMESYRDPVAIVSKELEQITFHELPEESMMLQALWKPDDGKELQGLTDVYEVVGRFCFQGENDENLAHVQAAVSVIRNEILTQRSRLEQLQKFGQQARAMAERLKHQETQVAAKARAEKLNEFDTLAATVHQRAQQTGDAMHAVLVPPLDDVATASEQYEAFVRKLDQVYQTCLPFLRKSIAQLYDFAGCAAPDGWPEQLPIQKDLPEQLLTVPPSGSPSLTSANNYVETLKHQQQQQIELRHGLQTTLAELTDEIEQLKSSDSTTLQAVQAAATLVDYATKLQTLAQVRDDIGKLEQQKADRTQAIGELLQKCKQVEAQGLAVEQELGKRRHEVLEEIKLLEQEKKAEPTFLGKEAWRNRVARHQQTVDDLKQAFANREKYVNELRVELASLQVQGQTEQSQSDLVDRWIHQACAQERELVAETTRLDQQLGPERAIHTPTVEQAEQLLQRAQRVRDSEKQRMERVSAEQRQCAQQLADTNTRLKQIEAELHKMHGFVESAQVAATQGFEEAMRQLAKRRYEAVSQHVADVIGELDASLSSVEKVFVEPARVSMLKALEPVESESEKIRMAGAEVERVMGDLAPTVDADLLATDAAMSKVQRDFCDVAKQACREAWG